VSDEFKHNDVHCGVGELVDHGNQEARRKPRVPAFMLEPVSKTSGDITVEIERRRKKRGWYGITRQAVHSRLIRLARRKAVLDIREEAA
tara:strand:+ start:903 stop:1169 length:267 start_codon:yes stop_codon:yes gene_type:complete